MGINEVNEVKKLGESSATAKVVSKYLASRERLSHESDVNRYKTHLKNDGEKIDDKEYDAFWKSAEKIGLGSMDKKGRFRWHYNLKNVGAIATGVTPPEGLEKLVKKTAQLVQKRPRGRPAGVVKKTEQVGYLFRDRIVFIPLDISIPEAEKLAKFITSVPNLKEA